MHSDCIIQNSIFPKNAPAICIILESGNLVSRRNFVCRTKKNTGSDRAEVIYFFAANAISSIQNLDQFLIAVPDRNLTT